MTLLSGRLVSLQKQRLDTAISAFQQQFSTAQQSRLDEFKASEKFRTETAEKNEQARQELFEAIEEQWERAAKKAAQAAAADHDELAGRLKGNAKKIIEDMETDKAHVQQLVGIISNTGMVHGYQKTANEEKEAAKRWKCIAAISLSIWIVVATTFFYLTYDKDLTWATVARQLLFSTPFVLLVGFAVMLTSSHQKNERGLRQAELEIASIDPFLATLDDMERNKVKKEYVARYFGQREAETKNESCDKKLIAIIASLAEAQQGISKR